MMYSKNAFKERLKIIYWEQSLPEFQFIKKILLFVWKDLHNDRFQTTSCIMVKDLIIPSLCVSF